MVGSQPWYTGTALEESALTRYMLFPGKFQFFVSRIHWDSICQALFSFSLVYLCSVTALLNSKSMLEKVYECNGKLHIS